MQLDKFIEALYDAGWDSPHDAQHSHIEKLWRDMFPAVAEIHDELSEAQAEIEGLTTHS